MKNKKTSALFLAAVIAAGCALPAYAEAFSVDNEIGGVVTTVTYDKVPEKAVSLAGFATQMMLALNLGDHMVGYSYMDNEIPEQYKEQFDKLICLAEGNPSQEELLAVEPDFLTGWASTFSEKNFPMDFCENNEILAYVPQVEYAPASMESVYADFENFGKIFDVTDRAEEIVTDMKDRVAAVQEAVKDEEPVTVFIYDSGEDAPFTASAGLPTDMIALAGGENIFAGVESNWTVVDWEDVIAADPDFIIIMDYLASDPLDAKQEFLKTSDFTKELTAVENDNIFVIGLTDVTGCYESVDAVETMAQHFHPDCF